MTSRTSLYDSGIGAEDSQERRYSAMKGFFNFVDRLEDEVMENEDPDPTIDLNMFLGKHLAVRPPSPVQQVNTTARSRQQTTSKPKMTAQEELINEELEEIISGLGKKRTREKLVSIMLKGMKETLGNEVYNLFTRGKLPPNWLPIIKMNDDNTPYVEFLIKSDVADQDPFNQMSDYTIRHMNLSKNIIDNLKDSSKCIETPKRNETPKRIETPKQKPGLEAPASKAPQHRPSTMTSSTPIKKRNVVPQKRQYLSESSLNESKRILPDRSCKSRCFYSK